MREIPILLSTDMVEATLAGRKNLTRRKIKGIPIPEMIYHYSPEREESSGRFTFVDEHPIPLISQKQIHTTSCPYGQRGDILWVRETWKSIGFNDEIMPQMQFQYKDGVTRWVDVPLNTKLHAQNKWKPSIHMMKAAARVWLRVKAIRVERLNDISIYDAWNEGVEAFNEDYTSEPGAVHGDYKNYLWRDDPQYEDYNFPSYADPVSSFESLWRKINGIDSWTLNPWVWVVEFEVISTTGYPKQLLK